MSKNFLSAQIIRANLLGLTEGVADVLPQNPYIKSLSELADVMEADTELETVKAELAAVQAQNAEIAAMLLANDRAGAKKWAQGLMATLENGGGVSAAAPLSVRERKLAQALKQAFKFIEYTECFRGSSTARIDMDAKLKKWREFRPSATGIGVGATYLNDAEFDFEAAERIIAEAEHANGHAIPLPEIFA